jgi:hypothetical protein
MRKKGRVKIWLVIPILFLIFIIGFYLSAVYRAKECARMAVCVSNLKQLGLACSLYADNFGGSFPTNLSTLYPDYVNSLDIFICPSCKPKVTETDVLNNFTICYEYVSGLTKKNDPECLLIYDREGNHRIGHHKGDRNILFVGGYVRGSIKKRDWPYIWQKHMEGLQKGIRSEKDEKPFEIPF